MRDAATCAVLAIEEREADKDNKEKVKEKATENDTEAEKQHRLLVDMCGKLRTKAFEPTQNEEARVFYENKYTIFVDMYASQQRWRNIMEEEKE